MLQKIKKQYDHRKAMVQGKYYGLFRAVQQPMVHDLYPYATDYYHELNPYFLFNIYRPDLMDFTYGITVRDGLVPFCLSMLTPFQTLSKLENFFIIHPKLAPFIPPSLEHRFCCWSITQRNQISISRAKTVLITGMMNDQSIGSKEEMQRRLSILKNLSPKTQIEIYCPTRKDPTESYWRDHNVGYEAVETIKTLAPKNKLRYLTAQELNDKSSFENTYLVDLLASDMVVLDKGIHHTVARKGGTVGEWTSKPPKDAFFELDVGFNHKIHVSPLPKTESVFSELIFYKKLNPNNDLMLDKEFHKLINQLRS
jgi:hypothetical protein